jgi:acetate kinase
MLILSINAGSSSVKVSVYLAEKPDDAPIQLAEAQIAGLTAPPCKLTYERGSEKVKDQGVDGVKSQEDAFEYILNHLTKDKGLSEISSRESITHACHRVVHGGDYSDAHIIDSETYHHLEDLTDLAPLHNASALAIVKSCMKVLPKAKNIAYFDSSFHATMPKAIQTYPIDPDVSSKNKLRKYGFHGISYAFITKSIANFLKKDPSQTSIIALHLGSGASACAIKNGKSLDTSMGLTPLAGLPGATRSGSVDPRSVLAIGGESLRLLSDQLI